MTLVDAAVEPDPLLPPTLRLGPVHLTVSHLDGSIAFYERAIGLTLHDLAVEDAGAALGGRHAGLYHFALLHPSRRELARAVARLASKRTRIEGSADHGVSESIYLRDPDDNGIELYADRPRADWPQPKIDGQRIEMYTIALDLRGLQDEVAGEEPQPRAAAGLVVGHLHLHVGDIERALRFYRDVLGFELMASLGSAAFVAAGGYHHHLGLNVWHGADVQPLPPSTAGLREWSVVLPSPADVAAVRQRVADAGLEAQEHQGGLLVRDPWQTALAVTTG